MKQLIGVCAFAFVATTAMPAAASGQTRGCMGCAPPPRSGPAYSVDPRYEDHRGDYSTRIGGLPTIGAIKARATVG